MADNDLKEGRYKSIMTDLQAAELQKKIMEHIIPFNNLPKEYKETAFEFITFRQELLKESDRGCALLGACHLEFLLEKALSATLCGSTKHIKNLFDFNGPLGTFSSRILLSHSIGLLSKFQLHDIQLIRKIRNEFGHTAEIISFENDKIINYCTNFKLIRARHLNNPKKRFITTVALLTGGLSAIAINPNKLPEKLEIDVEKLNDNSDSFMDIVNLILKG